ncbi:hypothetical protein [Sphingomonas sp. VL_57B]|uniref:hypothetical protein n=1 Tax=Pseudomonadota TaxID=1224 RepID=UPI0031F59CD2
MAAIVRHRKRMRRRRCWAWILCCEEGEDYGRVAVIGAGDRRVADSFTGFVKADVADAMSVC